MFIYLSFRQLVILGSVFAALGTGSVQASPVTVQTYTSLAEWQAAVSGEDVTAVKLPKNGLTTSFVTKPVKIGPLTFQQSGANPLGSFRNFIQGAPFEFSDNDGNANVALYTKYGVSTVNVTLGATLTGFGANFFTSYPTEGDNLVLYGRKGHVLATVLIPATTGFFGIVVTPAKSVKTMAFVSQSNFSDPSVGQGLSLENIEISQ